jgi:hypothetical protein
MAAAAPLSQIGQIIDSAINLVKQVAVLVWMTALVVFGWGIVRFIAAADNQEEIKKAKGIIWWGVIGMFVLASIVGIIIVLQRDFGVGSEAVISPPQF